jgi:hypothetical protein
LAKCRFFVAPSAGLMDALQPVLSPNPKAGVNEPDWLARFSCARPAHHLSLCAC